MDKKGVIVALSAFLFWGLMPLYWNLMSGFDSMFILANRFIWSFVCVLVLILAKKQMGEVIAVLKDWKKMKFLLPAALFITCNWGVYIYAVNSGRVLDASLGYYINPLVLFLYSVIFFKERCTKLEIGAFSLAGVGVIVYTLSLGVLPLMALVLAVSFATYGTIKKFAAVDANVGLFIETLIVLPFALLYVVFFGQTPTGTLGVDAANFWLLVGAGAGSLIPLLLYAIALRMVRLTVVALCQFFCPTIMLITGIMFLGATITLPQMICFVFIWAGLTLYVMGMFRQEKGRMKELDG